MRQAEHDSMVASIVALVLCSVIFIVAYGQVWRPFKAALCLLLGLGYSLGFTTLAIGHLNILTITFAPMLIGLAMDFGIHFISRYEEEMRNRRTETEAIERAMAFTGQGIIIGGVTMAAAFLAMALTDFKGIWEMGIISGCGVLLCLIPMMTCLPLLLRRGRQNRLDHHIGPTGQRRLEIELLWLRHPVLVLGLTLLLCAGAAFQFPRVHFDYDLLHLQSQALPSVIYEQTLIAATGASALYGEVIADSAAQAREYEEKLKRLPAVARVQSAADYFTEDQDRKLELIRSIKGELAGIDFAPMDRSPVQLEPLSATLYDLAGYLDAGRHFGARKRSGPGPPVGFPGGGDCRIPRRDAQRPSRKFPGSSPGFNRPSLPICTKHSRRSRRRTRRGRWAPGLAAGVARPLHWGDGQVFAAGLCPERPLAP